MRLIAVSVVKNEADIIEAFVRHAAAWVDLHLVLDDDSTDGTRAILLSLQAEGMPLRVFGDDIIGHIQQARSNRLTHIAAEDHSADWIIPLDADEFITGGDRSQLEVALAIHRGQTAVTLPLHDYCVTTADDHTEPNPVLRTRYRRSAPSVTRKILIPRAAALDPELTAGKGSHALYRDGTPQASAQLPAPWCLAHFALRSPQHQLLRVVRAELQRLSRGQAGAGLDVHYRLGYQLLSENPDWFFDTLKQEPTAFVEAPLRYLGGPLKYTPKTDWSRVARALFPYLEQLARSHGRLADQTGFDVAKANPDTLQIRELVDESPPEFHPLKHKEKRFANFTPLSGWCQQEGPVPEAFLPHFHWGMAPATELSIECLAGTAEAFLTAECLTYSDGQSIEIFCNDQPVGRLDFPHINQREHLKIRLPLLQGTNRVVLRYQTALVTDHDSRALAVIFISLRVIFINPAT